MITRDLGEATSIWERAPGVRDQLRHVEVLKGALVASNRHPEYEANQGRPRSSRGHQFGRMDTGRLRPPPTRDTVKDHNPVSKGHSGGLQIALQTPDTPRSQIVEKYQLLMKISSMSRWCVKAGGQQKTGNVLGVQISASAYVERGLAAVVRCFSGEHRAILEASLRKDSVNQRNIALVRSCQAHQYVRAGTKWHAGDGLKV